MICCFESKSVVFRSRALSCLILIASMTACKTESQTKMVGPDRAREIAGKSHEFLFSRRGKDVNELHDRQKLYVAQNDFGVDAEVFANPEANKLQNVSDFSSAPILVATVSSDGDYGELQIANGLTCYYLQYDSLVPDTKKWKVFVHAIGTGTGVACPPATNLVHRLKVSWDTYLDVKGNPLDSIIGAARFMQVPSKKKHQIGVKCANAWCAINPISGGHNEPQLQEGESSRSLIPTWYDEQYLADNSKPAQHHTLLAKIVPDYALGGYTISDFERPKPVAYITLNEPSDWYRKKLNLGFSEDPSQRNDLYLYHVRGDTVNWYALVFSAEAIPPALYEVERHSDGDIVQSTPGFTVPGTARWAWKDDDESAWIRCAEGCCQLTGAAKAIETLPPEAAKTLRAFIATVPMPKKRGPE